MSAGTGLVMGFYGLLAIPGGAHWMMPPDEAKQFCQLWQNVLRHYPVSVTQKAFDWAMCISGMGYMNIPRIYKTIHNRRNPQPQRPAAQIFRVVPGGAAASPGAPAAVTPTAEAAILAEGPPDFGIAADGI